MRFNCWDKRKKAVHDIVTEKHKFYFKLVHISYDSFDVFIFAMNLLHSEDMIAEIQTLKSSLLT